MLGKKDKEAKGSEAEKKAGEAQLPPTAVQAKSEGKEVKAQAPVNELVFVSGEEIKVKDLPFKVVSFTGKDVVLRRQDID